MLQLYTFGPQACRSLSVYNTCTLAPVLCCNGCSTAMLYMHSTSRTVHSQSRMDGAYTKSVYHVRDRA